MLSLATYLFCFIPLLILAITALVRANDIGRQRKGWNWVVRKIGLVLVGAASIAFLLEPIWIWNSPWIYRLGFFSLVFGMALTWLTTPGMPPWWKYVSGFDMGEQQDARP